MRVIFINLTLFDKFKFILFCYTLFSSFSAENGGASVALKDTFTAVPVFSESLVCSSRALAEFARPVCQKCLW